ncbi:prepilin peptidase [Pectinatus haikarae]|uniref:Leader peptidase (Prepilin peptidase)/N-methyltransferase n=1 Tax=Pectinatus haikarae TaxID=349096 RepID=A0ABT9Y8M2_9FIRM|nr:prepilin peptidase [Pectinatus haikarae]MDQ0204188.1 leader peptidase (prepilin peptidase)/N-methyltransferase [Pectinatus haikarae]
MKIQLPFTEIICLTGYCFLLNISEKYAGFIYILLLLAKVAYIDYKSYLIPNKLPVFIAFGGCIHQLMQNEYFAFWNVFFALIFISMVFLPIYFFTDTIGGGDVKLSYALCLWLPYPLIAQAIFFAVFSASLLCIYRILQKEYTLNDILPFGPFISLGALIIFSIFYF